MGYSSCDSKKGRLAWPWLARVDGQPERGRFGPWAPAVSQMLGSGVARTWLSRATTEYYACGCVLL
jgi:hypothetical protein